MTRIQSYGLAVLVVTAACAAGTASVDRSATFLSATPSPQGRVCHAAANPPTLPSADAVIDSAAVMKDARLGAAQDAGYDLFSVQFDNQGHVTAFHTIESSLRPERTAVVEQLTLNRVRAQPADNPWSIRLKVTSDSAPRVQVGRSEICPALIIGNLDVMTRTTVTTSSGRGRPPSSPTAQPEGTPHFAVLVDSAGKLVDLKLTKSSGFGDVDQQTESALRRKTFHPTLLDGAPILAWTQWPPAE